MRYLTKDQICQIHRSLIAQSGGNSGIRDAGALDSAVAQPMMTFDGVDLYTTTAAKAAALGHAIIQNHPFIDGNKRVGHASMEVFLILNGFEINASVDTQETLILDIASGNVSRSELIEWLVDHLIKYES